MMKKNNEINALKVDLYEAKKKERKNITKLLNLKNGIMPPLPKSPTK
jgi:hypothetical protein